MAKKVLKPQKKISAGSAKWYEPTRQSARLILIIACVVCYGNTLINDYAFDDDFAFTKNEYVQKGMAGIPDLLTHPYFSSGNKTFDYRPVAGLSFAIEKQFFGNNPHVSHAVNIILYALFILLVLQVLEEVFELNKVATILPLLITLAYAVHPSHTEVVASIKNREEMLAALFSMAALIYFARLFKTEKQAPLNGFLAFLFFALAILSKLTALPLLAIFILTGFFYGWHKQSKKFIGFNLIVIIFAAVYFLILYSQLKRTFYFDENPLPFTHDLSVKLSAAMETVFFYFRFTFFPYPFSFYYGYNTVPLTTLNGPLAFASLVAYLTIFISAIYLFVKKRVAGVFLLGYLAYLSIYSNLVMVYTGIVSERALFMPGLWLMAGVFVPVASNLKPTLLKQLRPVLLVLGLAVLIALVGLTIQRNAQWKNNFTLMASDIGHLQNSTLANFMYGELLQDTGEKASGIERQALLDSAKKYYHQANVVNPYYAEPYYKLGMIAEYDEHQNDSAFHYFNVAYPLDTGLTTVNFQLAKLLLIKGLNKEANPLFERVYQQIPTDTFNLFFYAQNLFFEGDTPRAYKINEALLQVAPGYYHPYLNRGMFNKIRGNMPAAAPDLQEAFRLGFTDINIYNALLNYYLQTGHTEKVGELQKYQPK